MEKAQAEDPNAFLYDEIYGDMQNTRHKKEELLEKEREERKVCADTQIHNSPLFV